jgi:hypothetical protein
MKIRDDNNWRYFAFFFGKIFRLYLIESFSISILFLLWQIFKYGMVGKWLLVRVHYVAFWKAIWFAFTWRFYTDDSGYLALAVVPVYILAFIFAIVNVLVILRIESRSEKLTNLR